jgi:hypothetical protein
MIVILSKKQAEVGTLRHFLSFYVDNKREKGPPTLLRE